MENNVIKRKKPIEKRKKRGTFEYPVEIYESRYNDYENGKVSWHWHKEFEFVVVIVGKVIYSIGDEEIELTEGEGIFVNSNILHQIVLLPETKSIVKSIIFDPTFIAGARQSIIESKYVLSVAESKNIRYIRFTPVVKWQKDIINKLLKAYEINEKKEFAYEFEVSHIISGSWLIMLKEIVKEMPNMDRPVTLDEERLKMALNYIHEHYAEPLALENIAAKAHISKSECCRCFKRILHITPIEYVMYYRIEEALKRLYQTNDSISDIAFSVGFNGTSYFNKVFRKYVKCTPKEFRKSIE